MKGKIHFIDANIFVNDLVLLDKERNKAARALIQKIEDGSLLAVTDYLALSETFYILESYKGRETALEMVKKLLTLETLEIIPMDHITFFEGLKRAKKYKLIINDLIHYTIALLNNVAGIYSYDKDFDGLEIKRMEP